MAIGAALGFALSRHLSGSGCCGAAKKTRHPKVHVLLVHLEFSCPADKNTWCAEFQELADTVYANEPNCLSYEVNILCV